MTDKETAHYWPSPTDSVKGEPIQLTKEDMDKIKQTIIEHMMEEKSAVFDALNTLSDDVEELAGAINANHNANAKDIKKHVTKEAASIKTDVLEVSRLSDEDMRKAITDLCKDRAEEFRVILKSTTSDELRRMTELKKLRKSIEGTVKAVMCAMAVMNILAIAYIILR